MLKVVVVAYYIQYHSICLGGLRETTNKLIDNTCPLDEESNAEPSE
jgi:hypothetical protein